MRKTIYTQNSKLVAEALREMRERAGLTQRELCRRIGKQHSFISKCELGERRVDLVEWYGLCEACGADPKVETRKLLDAFSKSGE